MSVAVKRSVRQRARHRQRVYQALLFLLPGLALYSTLILYPTVQSLIYSVQDLQGRNGRFVGLDNFSELIHDKYVWIGALNNLRVLLVTLVFQLPIALMLAYLLSRRSRFAGAYRFLYFVPGLVGAATLGLLWTFIYQKQGLLNGLLNSAGLSGWTQPWLSGDGVVQWTVTVPGIYAGIGFFVIIYMAAISQIPDALYEAAAIDGANSWRQFINITVPSIKGVYMMTMVLAVIDALSAYVFPFILTQNGPLHRTETLTSYAVWQSWFNYRPGYGAAIAVFHFAIAITATMIIRRFARREQQESKAL